jgi:hypothetical protein
MWELGVGVLISGLIYFGSDKLPKQILYREKREELIKKLTTNASDRTQILTKYKDMFTDEEIEQFTTDEDRFNQKYDELESFAVAVGDVVSIRQIRTIKNEYTKSLEEYNEVKKQKKLENELEELANQAKETLDNIWPTTGK